MKTVLGFSLLVCLIACGSGASETTLNPSAAVPNAIGAPTSPQSIASLSVMSSRASVNPPGFPPSPGCRSEFVAVTLNGMPQTLHGDLCDPGFASTIFVTVPGASYNRYYWDFPYHPEIYSQARSLNEAGYAVFNVDRLGTGLSSVPLSTFITGLGQANVYYQAILTLRAGAIGFHRYSHVVLLSHSLGAGIATLEATAYGGVDGVVLTGDTHYPNPQHEQTFGEIAIQQANLQPKFAHYDNGYLTTPIGNPPGSIRQEVFYGAGDFDPITVIVDEDTKDVYSSTEVVEAAEAITDPSYTRNIRVPVLLTVGGQDFLACATPPQNQGTNCSSAAAFRAQEILNYSPQAQLETCVLPFSGHSMDLALNTGQYQVALIEWARRYFSTQTFFAPGPRQEASICSS
jgi:pimeloyl-ACP methyl ester carboxylesterase